jgi:hypothetical protein
VPERKLGNFFKSKEGGNYNRRNTFKYFEDYNLRLTQILGKLTVFVQALNNISGFLRLADDKNKTKHVIRPASWREEAEERGEGHAFYCLLANHGFTMLPFTLTLHKI